jgi:hypothetical protein
MKSLYYLLLLAPAVVATILANFELLTTPFNNPIAAAYHAPSRNLIVTAYYSSGLPHSFRKVDEIGVQSQFSTMSGLGDELKLTVVRPENAHTGFIEGDLFTGNGKSGGVARVSNNGLDNYPAWCQLYYDRSGTIVQDVGLLRGSLEFDAVGTFDNLLCIVTTSGYAFVIGPNPSSKHGIPNACEIKYQWYVGSSIHLEGLTVAPNDVTHYGEIAGKMIAGDEGNYRLWAFAKNIAPKPYNTPGVQIEDLDYIYPDNHFFGVNYGTGTLLGVKSEFWTPYVGKILATMEFKGLFVMTWGSNSPTFERIDPDLAKGSFNYGQWEHVTFAPAGVSEVLPSGFSICLSVQYGETVVNIDKPVRIPVIDVSWYTLVHIQSQSRTPPIQNVANTLLVYITQDYKNEFSMIITASSAQTSSLTLTMESNNIGVPSNNPPSFGSIKLYDKLSGDAGPPGNYFVGNGQFQWSWTASQGRRGMVIGPLDIANNDKPLNMRFTIESNQITSVKFITQKPKPDDSLNYQDIPKSDGKFSFKLQRFSCDCGNNKKNDFEDCDNNLPCCFQCLFKANGAVCRDPAGVCDSPEYCSGNSDQCGQDLNYGTDRLCRAASTPCDEDDYCTGNSINCVNDFVSPATKICRPSVVLNDICDPEEKCLGDSKTCPNDVRFPTGTPCTDDVLTCSPPANDTHKYTCSETTGKCTYSHFDQFCGVGICNDNLLASGEYCDKSAVPEHTCCVNCESPSPAGTVCRPSADRCDKPEYCLGDSPFCPVNEAPNCPECNVTCQNGACHYAENYVDTFCKCDPGWQGIDCSIPKCDDLDGDCAGCSALPECGYCCSVGKCFLGTASGPEGKTCPTWRFGTCDCVGGCLNDGTCECGACRCPDGYSGSRCELHRDCFGEFRSPDEYFPVLTQCGCNRTADSCIGCDDLPNGLKEDNCGVCGGTGVTCWDVCNWNNCNDCIIAEGCGWCEESEICYNLDHKTSDCTVPTERIIEGDNTRDCNALLLTPEEIATISGGLLALIIIGSIIGCIVTSYGGKKFIDYARKYAAKNNGVQSNPLFKENEKRRGNNPLYEHPSST